MAYCERAGDEATLQRAKVARHGGPRAGPGQCSSVSSIALANNALVLTLPASCWNRGVGGLRRGAAPPSSARRHVLDRSVGGLPRQRSTAPAVTQEAWRRASLDRCLVHPVGGCGFARHGTYERVEPPGTRVARCYCRPGKTTFSLLPDCLASHLSGSLEEVEEVAAHAEAAASVEEAAVELRPDITLLCAVRWVRRRTKYARLALVALVTLLPARFAGCVRVSNLRRVLHTKAALRAIREELAAYLSSLPTSVGFAPHRGRGGGKRAGLQHEPGTDSS